MLGSTLIESYRVSQRRACMVIMLCQNSFRYVPTGRDDTAVRARIKEIAVTKVRYGADRIHMVLKREGWPDNHKRVRRIYREEGLNQRSKRPKRSKTAAHRLERPELTDPTQCWSMDFVHDQLFNQRKIRALTVVDNFSRYCYAIEVKTSFSGIEVAETLERLKKHYGFTPKRIQVDNGSEFTSKDFDRWAQLNQVTLDYSRPGTPTDNPFIESFNGSFRDECLNTNWFLSIDDACKKIRDWRTEYNMFRPHSSLKGKTPTEVIKQFIKRPKTLL